MNKIIETISKPFEIIKESFLKAWNGNERWYTVLFWWILALGYFGFHLREIIENNTLFNNSFTEFFLFVYLLLYIYIYIPIALCMFCNAIFKKIKIIKIFISLIFIVAIFIIGIYVFLFMLEFNCLNSTQSILCKFPLIYISIFILFNIISIFLLILNNKK